MCNRPDSLESMACANISMPSTGLDSWGPASSCRHSAASCMDDDIDDHMDSSIDDTENSYCTLNLKLINNIQYSDRQISIVAIGYVTPISYYFIIN